MFFSHIYLTYSVVHCYVTRAGSQGGYQGIEKFAFEGTFPTCFLGNLDSKHSMHPSGKTDIHLPRELEYIRNGGSRAAISDMPGGKSTVFSHL